MNCIICKYADFYLFFKKRQDCDQVFIALIDYYE